MLNLLNKLQPYMQKKTDRHWSREEKLLNYENDYISVLRIDSSNKWTTDKASGFMTKMWSIIIKLKKDFSNIKNFKELEKSIKIKITPVTKGALTGSYGIRIYNMKQEPTKEIIKEILDFIFSENLVQ